MSSEGYFSRDLILAWEQIPVTSPWRTGIECLILLAWRKRTEFGATIEDLRNTVNHLDWINIYKNTIINNFRIYIFGVYMVYMIKIDHILGHDTCLYKLKWANIIQIMFYYHNGIKLEVNSNKILSHKKLNDTHLNIYLVKK